MDQQIRLSGCIGFHIFAIQGLLCLLCGIDDAIISPFFQKRWNNSLLNYYCLIYIDHACYPRIMPTATAFAAVGERQVYKQSVERIHIQKMKRIMGVYYTQD